MLLPETFAAALAMMLGSMLCWGSWTNLSRLARGWRLEFFHHDYAWGMLVVAVVAAATGGMLFGRPNVLDNLAASDAASVAWATVAGACLNAGNFLLMAGIARVGMTVAFPVSVGFSLVVSTVLAYLVRPLGDPALLAAGVALVFAAVVTNALVYRSHGKGRSGGGNGLAMCLAAGILFTMCGPMVAKALNTARPLAPYGVALVYAVGSLAITAPLLALLRRFPLDGIPLAMADYRRGTARDHAAGLAGGTIWGAGMVLNFLAAGLAGMAVSGAIGQANPLVAAAWGIFVWREFRGASRRTLVLLGLMIALYSAGLVLLALSFRFAGV